MLCTLQSKKQGKKLNEASKGQKIKRERNKDNVTIYNNKTTLFIYG